MKEFNYKFKNRKVILPILLNIGTQFETAEGTWQVHRIVKDDTGATVYCEPIGTEAWLLGHLEKSQYFVMNKSLPV